MGQQKATPCLGVAFVAQGLSSNRALHRDFVGLLAVSQITTSPLGDLARHGVEVIYVDIGREPKARHVVIGLEPCILLSRVKISRGLTDAGNVQTISCTERSRCLGVVFESEEPGVIPVESGEV